MKRKIGYLRVSTQEQRLDRQVDGLKGICDVLHIERLSAASAKRPVYEAVVTSLQPGDTLVVWDLDRAFRSTIDALTQAEDMIQRGVGFQVVTINLDTNTEDGMLLYTVIAALAQHERCRLSRRTKEGLEAARRRGKRLRRPPKLSPDQVRYAKSALITGKHTKNELAKKFGVVPWTLARALRNERDVINHSLSG